MKYEPRTHSLTLRLFSTVVLGMLALNILTLRSTHRLATSVQENTLKEYKQIQAMYADELTRQLTQAQERIGSISGSYLADMATSQEALGDQRAYEAVRCQTQISTACRTWKEQFPLITGYYMYGTNADVFIFEGTGYDSAVWFSDAVRSSAVDTNSPFRLRIGWQLQETPLGKMLLFNTLRRDVCSGAWVIIPHLLNTLLSDAETAGRFDIVSQDAEPGKGQTIDIPLSGCGCILRQTLPDTALELPASVRIMRILSYVMLLVLPASWLVLRQLVIRPLRELTHAIHEIDQGNTAYRIPENTTSYEFDQLNRKFNQSIETIANARSRIYETQLENERTRIRYLTQQMQPHFVLNTLNLIYSMEPSQYPLIQKTVQCLSRYYRYVAHISEPLVPIEAELEHVKNYFELQTIRYPDSFVYSINCPEELKEALIPPIVIQTFAENAIKHSLTVGEENRVDVSIMKKEDRLHICIHDSGTGYPIEVLKKIQEFQKTKIQQEGLGLGIQNTIERIDLLYETGADLIFSNAANGGAQVDIFLPAINQDHRMSTRITMLDRNDDERNEQ